MEEKYIDLHIHSTNSDGELSPNEIINEAKRNNTKIIAITDHDFVPESRLYTGLTINNNEIKVIPGAELSTDYYIGKRKIRIHLLAYDVIDKDGLLRKELEKMRVARLDGNYTYIKKMLTKFLFIDKQEFEKFDYSKYGWIEKRILKQLDLKKYKADDIKKLKEYLEVLKPKYSRCTLEIEEAIALVKRAGGFSSFAHPYQTKLNFNELKELVCLMKEFGLDSIETFHVEANKTGNETAKRLADEFHLLESCGSDFHKFNGEENRIGTGINNNMKINQISLSDYMIEKKRYYFNGNYKGDEIDER